MQEVTPRSTPWKVYAKTWTVSVAVMFVSSAASTAALFSLEGVPAALCVAAFLTPLPALFLAVERKWRGVAKHVVYHLLWIPAAVFFLGSYFTASEAPMMGPIVAFFVCAPAVCGYAALLLCEGWRR